jgi:hypothetical protein
MSAAARAELIPSRASSVIFAWRAALVDTSSTVGETPIGAAVRATDRQLHQRQPIPSPGASRGMPFAVERCTGRRYSGVDIGGCGLGGEQRG